MWETQVWSLSRADPLQKEMATHSSTLAWKIPWTEEPGRLQSMRLQRVGHDWATSLHCTQLGMSFPFSFAFHLSSFLRYFKGLLRQLFCLLAFLVLWDGFGHHFLYSVMNSVHSSSGTPFTRSNLLNLFVTSTIIIRDLIKSYRNGLVVFPTFFKVKLNFAIMSSGPEPQSTSCPVFCSLYRAFPPLVLTIWWCPCAELSLILLKMGFCYDQWVLLAKLC